VYKQRLPAVWGSCAYFLEMDLRRRRVRPTTFWTPSHRLGVLGLHCITAVISLITLGVSLGFFSHQSPQLEMPSVTRWVCMGCHQPNQHGGPTSYFADYKAAACHYAYPVWRQEPPNYSCEYNWLYNILCSMLYDMLYAVKAGTRSQNVGWEVQQSI